MSKLAQAESAFERGDLNEAEMFAAQAMNETRNADTLAAFARVIGENGRRPDAAGILVAVVDQYPKSGFLRTLLGEQQVRLGQWGPGTQNFVRGLNIDGGHPTALLHTQMVVADLVAAHKAGKVSAEDATQFVNGILYNVAHAPDSLKSFLGTARRAINQNRTVQEAGGNVPPDNILIPGRIDHAPPRPPRPPTLGRGLAVGGPQPTESGARRQDREERQERQSRRNRPITTVGAGITMERVGRDHSIADLMSRDRQLNEQIQQTLSPLGLPRWPSDTTLPSLDMIPAMQPKTLGFTADDIRATDAFTFTEGSINAEIVMERAWNALREAAAVGSARPIEPRPADLTKLEVALWDRAVERMRDVPRMFDDEPEYKLPELALGKFIGDVICKHYGGFWYYERTPGQSFIQIAGERIDPLEISRAWFRAEDKDDVSLEEPILRAASVSDREKAVEAMIDVVSGLDTRALALKLAEQWVLFRTHSSDTQLVNVAASIAPADRIGQMIVFRIDAKWAPPNARGRGELGLDSKGRVAIAYDRQTDQFFVLGSRKHFALFLHEAEVELNRESLQRIADLFDAFHCPAVKCVRTANDELGPKLEQAPGGANFLLAARGGNSSVRWRIAYRSNDPIRWKIEYAQ